MSERERIRALFDQLMNAPVKSFQRGMLDEPKQHGVYVIYSPRGKVLYVGRTYRANFRANLEGLQRRLTSHRKKYGPKGCKFRCLIVKSPRQRALLEAYATGCLCPVDLGLGEVGPKPYVVSAAEIASAAERLAALRGGAQPLPTPSGLPKLGLIPT
jgi:hypothetical protein